ncbi:MAG: pseudoazurin [Pseudomonadota bacterium]
MSHNVNRRTVIVSAAATAAALTAPKIATASESVTVEMLNKHPDDSKKRYVFYPRVISVQPGDTVVFKSVDRGHNSASIDGMLPEGAEEWNGKINDDIEVSFDQPGFYGYMCTPHATVGMVGLVVVEGDGKLDNLEAAQGVRQRGKSKKEWEEIWAEAEELGLLNATTA